MKVGIVEDHSLMADLLATLCRRDFNFDVVINETQGRKALAAMRRLKPELLLLDISLPDMDGLDLAEVVLRDLPATKVLVLSSLRDPVTVKRINTLGLHGFVDKRDQNVRVLRQAIGLVSQGTGFFSPVFQEVLGQLRRDPKAFHRVLSEYEGKVLAFIGEAKSDEEIARALGVTAPTIQSRRRDIMRKLGIHTTPKLIRYAIETGFTRTEYPPPKRKTDSS
jgi:DNA-binding NarL/FixJ family response regulator